MPNRNLLLSSGKQTISVTLKVINSSGNAIKNARIEIQELGSFTTDNNGKVFLEGLLENEIYRVTISAPGYTSISNRFATNTDPRTRIHVCTSSSSAQCRNYSCNPGTRVSILCVNDTQWCNCA